MARRRGPARRKTDRPSPAPPRAARVAGTLPVFAFMACFCSVRFGDSLGTLADYAKIVKPARATLRSTVVKEWIPGGNHWSAFGTFDIVAGDYSGSAEGSLIPRSFYSGKPRRYRVPRAEAETFLPKWVLGRTYDGYWNPENPTGVFFDPVDPGSVRRLVRAFRIAAGALFIAALLAWRMARQKPHHA